MVYRCYTQQAVQNMIFACQVLIQITGLSIHNVPIKKLQYTSSDVFVDKIIFIITHTAMDTAVCTLVVPFVVSPINVD